jgi:hypothetical protein
MSRLLVPAGAVAALLVLVELLLGGHGRWPGISAGLGLAGALALVAGARTLGRLGIQRPDPDAGPPAARDAAR